MRSKIKIPLLDVREVGYVKEVKRGIAKISGLPNCVYGQLIQFAQGIKGIVMGFNPKEVLVIILGEEGNVSVGDSASSLTELLTVPVGDSFIGRTVNGLAEPVDSKGPILSSNFYPVFREAPGVMEREPIDQPILTGIKIIDLTIPIGKGQRELIIGDRQTGKSSIGIDAIINQKGKGVVCIYCWIGGSNAALRKILYTLNDHDALKHTIVVASPADTSAAEQYLAPYTAASLGEYFMHNGKDVLVVFDDLTKHAWIYRQMSLLLERSPGREAYPGDIFYLHSQLMERAGKLNEKWGSGSMTFLPVVETLQGDITGYIQTNLISMTDGQIYVSNALFKEGFKPAIDLGLSVSRIGSKVQSSAVKEVSQGLRLEYARYREMLRLTKLRTHLSSEAAEQMARGEALRELLIQTNNRPLSTEEEVVLFYAFKRRVLENLPVSALKKFIDGFFAYLLEKDPDTVRALSESKELSRDIKESLDKSVVEFFGKVKEDDNTIET